MSVPLDGGRGGHVKIGFRFTFGPPLVPAWGSNPGACQSGCLFLIDKLASKGIPLRVVPISHIVKLRGPKELLVDFIVHLGLSSAKSINGFVELYYSLVVTRVFPTQPNRPRLKIRMEP